MDTQIAQERQLNLNQLYKAEVCAPPWIFLGYLFAWIVIITQSTQNNFRFHNPDFLLDITRWRNALQQIIPGCLLI